MSWMKPRFLIVLALGLLVTELAWAHGYGHWNGHHRAHVGVVIGVPLVGAWQYRPPVYTYPPVVTLPSVPQAYIEKNAREQQQQGSWWYYCRGAQGYYPYVRECPQGWELVSPQPPDLR